MKKKSKKKGKFLQVITYKILYLVAIVIIFLLFDIDCLIKNYTGFTCPLCGTTSACVNFLKGWWFEAFYAQPLFWLTVLLIFVKFIKSDYFIKSKNVKVAFVISVILIYLSVYIVRMWLLFPYIPPMDYNFNAPLYEHFLKDLHIIPTK